MLLKTNERRRNILCKFRFKNQQFFCFQLIIPLHQKSCISVCGLLKYDYVFSLKFDIFLWSVMFRKFKKLYYSNTSR